MASGGKRAGAGRKPGKQGGKRAGAGRKSKEKMFKELSMHDRRMTVMNFMTDDDIKEIVEGMIKRAKGDAKSAKYLMDQFIGKALQATDITSGGEKIGSFNDEQVSRIAERIASRRARDGSPSSS